MGIKSLIRIKSCEQFSRKILIRYGPLRMKLILKFMPIPNGLSVRTHSDHVFPVLEEIFLTVDVKTSISFLQKYCLENAR